MDNLRRMMQFAEPFPGFQIVSPLATQLAARDLNIVVPLERHFTPIALLHVTDG